VSLAADGSLYVYTVSWGFNQFI